MDDVLAQMLLSKDGVFVHEPAANGEDDIFRSGTVFLWNKVGDCSLLNICFMAPTITASFGSLMNIHSCPGFTLTLSE